MRKLKKITSFLAAAAIALSFPVSAFAAEGSGYSDVPADAWYAEAVTYCGEHGLMSGISDTAFAPEDSLTRAMLAAVLYRAAGSPSVSGNDDFTDTAEGAWYGDAVLWASQQGFVSGYGNGRFGTGDPVSREQLASVLWRYAGSPAAEGAASFRDSASAAAYAASAVKWSETNGIMRPVSEGVFAPKSDATRAQVAAALMNLFRGAEQASVPEENPDDSAKILVAYFSATNTTRPLAGYIADGLGTDLFEIVPETPYTSADLNYGNSSSRTSIEMNDPDSRPAISGTVEDMGQYDVVFLGYPIWWGEAPRIISTFLESYDFSGKTIIPFCTSGSSGIGSSAENLHPLAGGAAWLDGRRFSGGTGRDAMIEWANGMLAETQAVL